MTAAHKDAVAYIRVSSEEQAKGHSPEAQLKDCREYCHRHGFVIDVEHIESITAAKADRRPAFDRMVKHLRRNPGSHLVVIRLDRLSRNDIEGAKILEIVKRHHVTLHCVHEGTPLDERSTPSEWMAHRVKQAFAILYSEDLSTKAKRGQRARVEKGLHPNTANVAYGYRWDKELDPVNIAPIEPAASLVRFAWATYRAGNSSYQTIANEMNRRGYTNKRGPITAGGVEKLLKNKVYCGIVVYKGVEYPGRHEPLVSRADFEAIQEMMKARRTGGGYQGRKTVRGKRVRVYTGHLQCGCDASLCYHRQSNGTEYWRCRKTCGAPYVRQDRLDAAVREMLSSIRVDDDTLGRIVGDMQIVADEPSDDEQTRKRLAQVERALGKLKRLHLEGDLTIEEYRADKATYLAEQQELVEQLQSSERSRDTLTTAIRSVKGAVRALADAAQRWDRATPEQRREILSALWVRSGTTRTVVRAAGDEIEPAWAKPWALLPRNRTSDGGSAEILVVSNNYMGGGDPCVQAIRDIEDRWIQARRIWNQHTYHVTNVREDGTIPQFETPSWTLLNTFRTNAQIEGGAVCQPEPEG